MVTATTPTLEFPNIFQLATQIDLPSKTVSLDNFDTLDLDDVLFCIVQEGHVFEYEETLRNPNVLPRNPYDADPYRRVGYDVYGPGDIIGHNNLVLGSNQSFLHDKRLVSTPSAKLLVTYKNDAPLHEAGVSYKELSGEFEQLARMQKLRSDMIREIRQKTTRRLHNSGKVAYAILELSLRFNPSGVPLHRHASNDRPPKVFEGEGSDETTHQKSIALGRELVLRYEDFAAFSDMSSSGFRAKLKVLSENNPLFGVTESLFHDSDGLRVYELEKFPEILFLKKALELCQLTKENYELLLGEKISSVPTPQFA